MSGAGKPKASLSTLIASVLPITLLKYIDLKKLMKWVKPTQGVVKIPSNPRNGS